MSVGKPGYGVVRRLNGLERSVARDAHRVAVDVDRGAGLAQLLDHGFERLGARAGEHGAAARRGHGGEVGAGFDAVRHHAVGGAMQPLDAFDDDAIGACAADARAHRAKARGEVDDLRLARRVLQHGRAGGERRRHHQVLGAGDGDEVEHEARAGEPRRARADVAAVEIDLGAHRHEALDVQVDRTQADAASARQRHARFAAARDERAQREDRRAHRLHQLVGRERPVDRAGVERHLARRTGAAPHAHLRQELFHRARVVELRHVGDRQRLGGQQRRAEDRQRGVLGAGNLHFAMQRLPALDQKLVHALLGAGTCPVASVPAPRGACGGSLRGRCACAAGTHCSARRRRVARIRRACRARERRGWRGYAPATRGATSGRRRRSSGR